MTRPLRLLAVAVLLCLGCFSGLAQHRAAPPEPRYHRLVCLVHMTGSGKKNDPRRPEYVPTAATMSRDGIVSWSMQPTDDKNMAILHVVAVNRTAFNAILADKRGEVRVFEVGKDSKTAIEGEMGKYKKGFSLDSMKVVAR